MDYFVSFTKYEPASNARFYTEKHIRLPGCSSKYLRPALPSPVRPKTDFGVLPGQHLYLCPQSLFKFHPDFDWMLLQVLRRDTKAVLGLVRERHEGWGNDLMTRLRRETARLRKVRTVAHSRSILTSGNGTPVRTKCKFGVCRVATQGGGRESAEELHGPNSMA